MKEYFDSSEHKKFDEYKVFKAENYYKPENMIVKKEYLNKVNESLDEKTTQEKDKVVIKDNNKPKLVQKVKKTESKVIKDEITRSSPVKLTQKIIETASSMVGQIAATVACAVGVVALCTTVLTSKASMKVIDIDTGPDYVSYKVDVQDLDEELDYFIRIDNENYSYDFKVDSAGENEGFLSGLKPYSEYQLSLITIDDDIGLVVYSSKSFHTLKASSPTSLINYDYDVGEGSDGIVVNYSAYISDPKNTGKDYYLEVLWEDEVIMEDREVFESYISGSFSIPNDIDITINVYATVYDEIELIGTKTIHIYKEIEEPIIIDEFEEPVYKFSDDYLSCTATRLCINDDTKTITENVLTTYSVYIEPTTTTTGIGRYTAIFESDVFTTQYIDITLPMLIDLNNYNISEAYAIQNDGYVFYLKLNEYNPEVSYEVLFYTLEGDLLEKADFESDTLEVRVDELNINNIKLELSLSCKDKEDIRELDLMSTLGFSATFSDIVYSETHNAFIVNYEIESLYSEVTETFVSLNTGEDFVSLDTDNGGVIYINPISETFTLDVSVIFETQYGESYIDITSQTYNKSYSVELTEVSYIVDYETRYLVLKPIIYAPYSSELKISINNGGDVLESQIDPELNAYPDGYYVYIVNDLEDSEVEYFLELDEDILLTNSLTLNLEMESPTNVQAYYANPYDCAKTYNSDGTVNIYIPTDLTISEILSGDNPTSTSDYFLRVRIRTMNGYAKFMDITSGNLVFESVPEDEYMLTYYVFEMVDGINYCMDAVSNSGSIYPLENTAQAFSTGDAINIYISSESDLSSITNCRLIYSDNTSLDVTGEYNTEDNVYIISIPDEKEPVMVQFTYTNSEGDVFYWSDSEFTSRGYTKIGSDTCVITLSISV